MGRRAEGEYVDGFRVGVWHEWHTNGELQKEGRFEQGLEVGEWRMWHDNATLAALLFFDKGVKLGLAQEWHSNGKRSVFGNLALGRQQGPWFFWTEEGELDAERTGQYSGPQRVGELTEEELGAAADLAADPEPMLPDLPEGRDESTPEDG